MHLRRVVAPPRASHALQEGGDGERRIDLKRALQPPDVDAELKRRGGDGCLQLLLIPHDVFRGLAVAGREVSMMDEKAVRFMPRLAIAAQHGADGFRLLARVDKDQALAAARSLEDVAYAGVCVVGSGIRGCE